MTAQSILVVGATGRLGLESIHQLSSQASKPQVHAFCRKASKLSNEDQALCTSIVEGDARKSTDLENALRLTDADIVVISIGNGDNVAKSDIRTASAQALARVLRQPEFGHARVVVVSSTGAGTSRIKVGLGLGALITYHLRHVLEDHTGQESAFLEPNEDDETSLKDRTIIVRATALTDGKATGKVVQFEDKQKSPTLQIDRADVVAWIVEQLNNGGELEGRVVNITGKK